MSHKMNIHSYDEWSCNALTINPEWESSLAAGNTGQKGPV